VWGHVKPLGDVNEGDWLPGDDAVTMPPPLTRYSAQEEIRWAEQWQARDGVAKHIVVSRLSPQILAGIPKVEEGREARSASSRTIWEFLIRVYGGGSIMKAMEAWQSVLVLKVGQGGVTVRKLLANYREAYWRMVMVGETPTLISVLQGFARALPRSGVWSQMVVEYTARVDKREFEGVSVPTVFSDVESLLEHEPPDSTDSRAGRNRAPSMPTANSNSTPATVGTTSNAARPPKKKCTNCGRMGHEVSECWQPNGPLFRKEDRVKVLMDARKAKGVVAVAAEAKTGGGASTGSGITELASVAFGVDASQYDAVSAYFSGEVSEERRPLFPDGLDKLLDSGCSRHLFRDRECFWSYEVTESAGMTTANCGTLKTVGKGSVVLMIRPPEGRPIVLTLHDCRHAPDSPVDLLSVGTLQKKNIGVNFASHGTFITMEAIGRSFEARRFDTLSFVVAEVVYPDQREFVGAAVGSTKLPSPLTWHRRFGHLGMDATKRMLEGRYASGIEYEGEFVQDICPPCVIGKGARQPVRSSGHRASRLLELLHADICGPYPVSSRSGEYKGRNHYFIVILDDYSNYGHTALLKDRSGVGIVAVFKEVKARWENRTGEKVKFIRMDGAKELNEGVLDEFLKGFGADTQETAPYAHHQNGKAERYVRTIEDGGAAILAGSNLPASFWGDASLICQWLRNRCHTSTLPNGVTPYEMMHGQKPDLSNLRVFGCVGYAAIPPEKRRKGSNRREAVILVGYQRGRKGWWCVTPTGSYKFVYDVIFDEGTMGSLQREATAMPKMIRNPDDGGV
jgi:hypothetical protein